MDTKFLTHNKYNGMKILYFIFAAFLSCNWVNAQEKVPEQAVLFEDDFNDIEGSGGNDTDGWAYSNISGSVDINERGWASHRNVYKANHCVLVGLGKNNGGYAYTANLKFIGPVVITFKVAPAIYDSNNIPSALSVSLTSQGSSFQSGYSVVTPSLEEGVWRTYTYKATLKSMETKVYFNWNTNSCGHFFLDEVKITKDFYHRTGLTAGYFGTICMPFAVSKEDLTGAIMYSIAYKMTDGNGNVTGIILREETGDLVAGKPYIFKATATELFAIYNGLSATAVTPATGLVGNLSDNSLNVPQQSYILSGNQLRKVTTGTATVGQNRAYIDLKDVPVYENPTFLSKEYIYFDLSEGEMDLEDGISAVKGKTASATAYDLMGRKLPASGTKKGLVIKGGRKLWNVK